MLTRVLACAVLALSVAAGGAVAQTKPAKKKPAPAATRQAPQQDQSYLFLSPGSAPNQGPPSYVSSGMSNFNQPYYNSSAAPGGTLFFNSNR